MASQTDNTRNQLMRLALLARPKIISTWRSWTPLHFPQLVPLTSENLKKKLITHRKQLSSFWKIQRLPVKRLTPTFWLKHLVLMRVSCHHHRPTRISTAATHAVFSVITSMVNESVTFSVVLFAKQNHNITVQLNVTKNKARMSRFHCIMNTLSHDYTTTLNKLDLKNKKKKKKKKKKVLALIPLL